MVEVELKFQIPEARRAALLKAIDPKKSEQIQLKAKYFDTADKLLAQQHAAVRQRLEGDRWVQTLKAAGKTHIEQKLYRCYKMPWAIKLINCNYSLKLTFCALAV